MNNMEKKRFGKYHSASPNYDNTFSSYVVRVEILKETAKSYLVRLLEPTHTRVPNQTLWVRKRNVTIEA